MNKSFPKQRNIPSQAVANMVDAKFFSGVLTRCINTKQSQRQKKVMQRMIPIGHCLVGCRVMVGWSIGLQGKD